TQLGIREQLDLYPSTGSCGDVRHKALKPLVKRIGSCERCVDAQRVVGRDRGETGTERDDSGRKQRPDWREIHGVLPCSNAAPTSRPADPNGAALPSGLLVW